MLRHATRADVARAADVASSTVSRALSGSPLIPETTKERIRRVSAALGYVPSRQAALFAQRKTCRIGLVIPSYKTIPPFSRAYFPAVLDGAIIGAEDHGYYITIILDQQRNETRDLVSIVRSREVDGLLLTTTQRRDPRLNLLKKSGIPFVLINDYAPGIAGVDVRPMPGMHEAFRHVMGLGHSRFGYITGDTRYRNAVDRLAAFRGLAARYNIHSTIAPGNFSRRSGYDGAATLLGRTLRPTVIFTGCDRQAIGVIDYCRQHSLDVPGDVSVTGYDNLDPATCITPALTTVDNFVRKTAQEAAALLISMLEQKRARPKRRWLKSGFVIRQSTGPCKGRRA